MPALPPPRLPLTAPEAFARYEAVRPRLPEASFPQAALQVETLEEVADRWDGFLLDAFGVLNIGQTPIPGAIERMARLRAMGKSLTILTNAASMKREAAVMKFQKLGYDFSPEEIVTSRDVAKAALPRIADGARWGAISASWDDFSDLGVEAFDLTQGGWEEADAFLFLSALNFTEETRVALDRAMALRPRPLVIANPDIIAPNETAFSIEPGFWAHELMDRYEIETHWFGKPFGDAFRLGAARMGLAPARLAMVGDTLHTDILGGAAAGMGTVLIANHGLFAGHDTAPYIATSGIVPDVVAQTT